MKKTLIRILSILVVVLVVVLAFFYINSSSTIIEELNVEEVNVEELTGEVLSGDVELPATANFGTCKSELKDIELIKIDDVVKNCSVKQKTSQVDGVGGVDPQLFIYNDTFVEQIVASVDEAKTSQEFSGKNVICFQEGDWDGRTDVGQNRYYFEVKDDPSIFVKYYNGDRDDQNFHKNILEAVQKIVEKGLLNQISTRYSDNVYCDNGDEDCGFMTAGYGRSDGENYFVAGYRNVLGGDSLYHLTGDDLLFVINDKLYEAGNWQFAGIEYGKIIVKKIDITYEDNQERTFTLETCEIDL